MCFAKLNYDEQAIGEVNAGIDYSRQHYGRNGPDGIAPPAAPASFIKDQPHMHDAITSLQNARGNLRKAASDKGSHRGAAMPLIGSAINEVKQGIQFTS